MTNPLIGLRLKALREERSIDQSQLAKIIGVASHQIVSSIENGDRRVKPDEIEALLDHFKLDDDYFTDPFRLVGEGQFSWRQNASSPLALDIYRSHAGRWLAMYRALSSTDDRPGPKERRSLRLWENSTFEAACAEGERLTVDYKMGDVPSRTLTRVMEDDFGILVMMVDMEDGISGAACRLPELDAVLVNRRDNAGRRNFDLAHEFFHILTWDTMPPKPVELVSESSRIERLANNFAAALLMPQRLLARFGQWAHLDNTQRAARMRTVADYFQVSVTALHWRLVALKLLTKAAEILECGAGEEALDTVSPPLFSKNFFAVVGSAIDRGLVSTGKVAKLLDVSRDKLRDFFVDHGVPAPVTV